MIGAPLVRLRAGDQHSHIRPILVRFVHITQRFRDLEQFPRSMNPGVRLCVRRQH